MLTKATKSRTHLSILLISTSIHCIDKYSFFCHPNSTHCMITYLHCKLVVIFIDRRVNVPFTGQIFNGIANLTFVELPHDRQLLNTL